MRYRKIGTMQIEASVVGFGAWAIGGWMWGGTDEKQAIECIHACLDEGINFIDTAPIYGFGVSESILGKAIRGKRDRYVIATKCGLVTHNEGGEYFFSSNGQGADEHGVIDIHRNLRPASLRKELEKSLRRLGTDYIDLYQTHWQDSTTPIGETMETLLALQREGKIRAIGVSNASVDHLKEYLRAGRIDSAQERYSLLDRKAEAELLPFTKEHHLAFLAYSPLENGLLTGKIGPERTFNAGDLRLTKPRFSVENRRRIQSFFRMLEPMAHTHKTSLTSLVIAWTVDQTGVTHALCGARTVAQVRENASGGRILLSPEERALMRQWFIEIVGEVS